MKLTQLENFKEHSCIRRDVSIHPNIESGRRGCRGRSPPTHAYVEIVSTINISFDVDVDVRVARSRARSRARRRCELRGHFNTLATLSETLRTAHARPRACAAAPRTGGRANATVAPSRFAKPRRVQKTRLVKLRISLNFGVKYDR